ncbi:MAG: hypothetical protein P8Y24_06940 [Gammaproteobacteria bacterium]|jgi:hypothetical protein
MPQSNHHKTKIIFVYNADSGLFNTLTDIGHKVFSPQTYNCPLCDLTHGYFSMRKEWSEFLHGLDHELEFLHRDEFIRKYPDLSHTLLPVIFIETDHILTTLLDDVALRQCKDIDQLKINIREQLEEHHL